MFSDHRVLSRELRYRVFRIRILFNPAMPYALGGEWRDRAQRTVAQVLSCAMRYDEAYLVRKAWSEDGWTAWVQPA